MADNTFLKLKEKVEKIVDKNKYAMITRSEEKIISARLEKMEDGKKLVVNITLTFNENVGRTIGKFEGNGIYKDVGENPYEVLSEFITSAYLFLKC